MGEKRNKISGYLIRIVTVIVLSLPIFVFATWIQYTYYSILPVIYRYPASFTTPPYITGFPLFDSVFSGNWGLAGNIILHGILPTLSLTFIIIALFIKTTQTNIDRNAKDTSFITNSFTAGKLFGILFALDIVVEICFSLRGFGYCCLRAIFLGDTAIIIGSIMMLIILFSFTMFFSNIIPIVYKFVCNKISGRFESFRDKIHQELRPVLDKIKNKFKFSRFRKKKTPSINESDIEGERSFKTRIKIELKTYLIATLKSPFTIIGLGIIIYLGIISSFPQLFTIYSLNEVTIPYIPIDGIPYAPPSPDHPLGTTKYGYDILARLLYGTRDALIFGSIITIIGLIGGSIFGVVAGRLHKYVHNAIIGLMIMLFIIPGLILLIFTKTVFGLSTQMLLMGILLIPIFTGIVANAIRRESNYITVIKVVIKYIPLEMAFGIMLYQILALIGLGDASVASLGTDINWARGSFSNFNAAVWPGFYLFLIMLGLICLHEGLNAPKTPRDILIEPVITS